MDALIEILRTLQADEYVRFKYGKRVDAALKSLEQRPTLDAAKLEAKLNELLALVRAPKGGAPAASAPKRPRKKTPAEPAHA